MTDRRDDDFRVRPSASKSRGKGQRFVSRVLRQTDKASSGKSVVSQPAAMGGPKHGPANDLAPGSDAATPV